MFPKAMFLKAMFRKAMFLKQCFLKQCFVRQCLFSALPDLEKMVASCMADIPSDAEDDDIGDDADLLNELSELGGDDDEPETHVARQPSPAMRHCDDGGGTCAGEDLLSVIESRIALYMTAEQV